VLSHKTFVLGVTGGSGSGKTYFVSRLKERLEDQATVLSQDNYYLPREQQPLDPRGIANFDLPDSISLSDFQQDIERIRSGQTVELQEYTFNNPGLIPGRLVFLPRPILIVEGLFLLYKEEIEQMLDLVCFVDAPDHVKLRRRIVRDQLERGYEISDVLYRFENHVMPSYNRYIGLYKNQAQIVVNNESDCEKAVDVVVGFLREKLASVR
jgi:uridine kinase